MKNLVKLAFSILLIAGCSFSQAQTEWPKDIPFLNGGRATIYQPQPESFDGIILTSRSAISVNETAGSEAIFGVIFYYATMSTDRENRTVELDSITITNARFNGVDDSIKIRNLITLIETEVPKWELEMSLDDLVATIRLDNPNAEIYNNDPPIIIYRTKPSSLVVLTGEPIIQKDNDLNAPRVVNSPSLIFREGTRWNMYNGGVWYQSNSITTGWKPMTTKSKFVKSVDAQIKKQEKADNGGKAITEKPIVTDIIVATEPTELIQSDGLAIYTPIDSTSISYLSNSPDNVFKDTTSQTIYILLAGRWYKSSSLEGPWTFNKPDKMPDDFYKIPEGFVKDAILVSLAGTDAAEEAMVDALIPQTAKVDRKTATTNVEYDGAPIFTPIEGTKLQVAENALLTVFKEESGAYFVLDNGIWFTGTTANGPWSVATVRPKDVENIPMTNFAYNSKFVHIYQVTDEYTIQGFTSGYLGSYIQGDPVIVFGTGFVYHPWHGVIFIARPVTWGFGFTFHPWWGWGMSVGHNVSFMHIGFHFGTSHHVVVSSGWFGPPMFHPPFFRPPVVVGIHGHRPRGNTNVNINININNNNNINNRPNNIHNNRPGVATGNNNRPNSINNVTRPNTGNNVNRPNTGNNVNRPNTGNTANRPNTWNNNQPVARPGSGANNVFSDRDGNVFQRDNNGNISQRDNRTQNWTPAPNNHVPNRPAPNANPQTRPTPNVNPQTLPAPNANPQTRPTPNVNPQTLPAPNANPQTRPAPNVNPQTRQQPANNINRDMQLRERGNDQTNNFNQSQASQARPNARPANNNAGSRR